MTKSFFWNRPVLPEEAIAHLRAIIDAYHRMRASAAGDHPGEDTEIASLEKRFTEQPNTLWWTDIAQAELCTVPLLSDSEARARISGWRRRLREVAGESRYSQYVTGASPTNASAEDVRADLSECVRSVYYFYGAYGIAARSQTRVTRSMFVIALIILAAEAIIGYGLSVLTGAKDIIEFALVTSFFAILGSIVSVQRRLQDPNISVDPIYQYIQNTADRLSIALVSPLFGAIFGLIMYGLIRSQLVLASLVKFSGAAPQTDADAALLFVMGFAAGFAEQLIPDAINRIAARALSTVVGPTNPASQPSSPPPSPATTTSPNNSGER